MCHMKACSEESVDFFLGELLCSCFCLSIDEFLGSWPCGFSDPGLDPLVCMCGPGFSERQEGVWVGVELLLDVFPHFRKGGEVVTPELGQLA